MVSYDLFPAPRRPAAISAVEFHVQLRFFPDTYGQKLLDILRIGLQAEMRRNAFCPEPPWLLEFRSGPVKEAKALLNLTYFHIIKTHTKDPLTLRFHNDTGKIANELYWISKSLSDKKKIASFLKRYREYMLGDRPSFPRIPKIMRDRLFIYSTGTYGMDLIRAYYCKKPLPTQDYAMVYLVPEDSMVDVLKEGSLSEAVTIVDSHRR